MKTGKITAKLRDAVPVSLTVNGEESSGIRTSSCPDMLKEAEMTDLHFNVHMDRKITFEIHYEAHCLRYSREAHTKVSWAAKAAAQEGAEIVSIETPGNKVPTRRRPVGR